MSGHSKWATTKHRKGAKDSARAKVFAKIIRQVEVAAREANASNRKANAAQRDHSERLTAIGVMWRGPGVARRPAAV